MTIEATRQADNILPPRRSAIIALAIDSTARAYDMSVLTLAGNTFSSTQKGVRLYLTMQADGGAVYFQLSSSNSATLSDTASITAGSALAFANTYGAKIESGGSVDVRIDRLDDRYLVVKTASGTATLRFWASSQPSASSM